MRRLSKSPVFRFAASLPLFMLAAGGSLKYVRDVAPNIGEPLQVLIAAGVLVLAVFGLAWRHGEEMREAREEARAAGRRDGVNERIDFIFNGMGVTAVTGGKK